MSDDRTHDDAESPAAAPRRRIRWWRWLIGLVVALAVSVGASLLLVDTPVGHRFVAAQINDLKLANGLRFRVGRIDGSLYHGTRLIDLSVYDPQGLVFTAPRVELDWRPFAWLSNRLEIERLAIPRAALLKVPKTRPTGRHGPILPDFDIGIGALSVGRLDIAAPVLGVPRVARLTGKADIIERRALIDLHALVEGSDRLDLTLEAAPDSDRFGIAVAAHGIAGGVLSRAVGNRGAVSLDVGGAGSWTRWRGTARSTLAGRRVANLALAADAGHYTLSGNVAPAPFLSGKLQRLTAPRVVVSGHAVYADRRVDGAIGLRSGALALDSSGVVDLAANAYRDVRIKARLLHPAALFPNMTGQGIELRAILDGAFATARFDYRIDAERFAFDDTGFENAHAVGHGHLSHAPVSVPVRFTAARVTGVGDVAGGILRNLSVDGMLRVTPTMLTGDNLGVRSDKLAGRIGLTLDLRTGEYRIAVNGALGRYLIPGLGIVDVSSSLHVVPGPGGHGTSVVGRGEARMLRLDNAFFRSLAGGLPHLVTNLERTPDGVLHFSNLVLTAPAIRLTGNGFRRRDGSFHVEAVGTQASYGPVRLVLDGQIDHPTLDLLFARPNDALGLGNVRAHLDSTAQGFAFTAAGTSRLGAFAGNGAILLPAGGQASIAVAALSVAGTRVQGNLAIVDGGFDGKVALAGGGLTGELLFHPVGTVQRIEAHLDARAASLGGTTLRQGHVDAVVLLDPAGTSIDATLNGQGLRRGSLSLARFAGNARFRGGSGELRASIAGSRGRAFDVQFVSQVSPDRFSTFAQGTLDRRPLRLLSPAVVVRDGDGWRLQPTRLSFAGGEAQVGGRFSSAGNAVDASLTRMPLAILDIGYPGLGLGGIASGLLHYATAPGTSPSGRADLTIRGLTRSGLVLSSRPIDVGLAALLTADKVGARAVIASGGATIGRAQMLVSPLGPDGLANLATAPMIAQLRYAGPADTLWRLTGVELFDLSGPVSIAADVGGSLSRPTIRGALQARGARIESANTGTVLTNVQANGRFGGSRLQIDRFVADAGKGGHVTGAGAFDFAAAHGIGIDLRLQADNAVMINRDDIGATVSGPLSFRSDGAGGTISGNVVLNRSRYRLGQATAASAVPQIATREINLPAGAGADPDDVPRQPWTLAIHARAPDAVRVSGLGLSSEWSADLQLAGAPDNPAITGRATLIRGDYEFAGREFQLDRGVIRFTGDVPANPALDIEANADSTGLNASIRVTGNALKPEISFTSTPALPEDELLSRLLFGTSITKLSAPEALQLAAAVAALQNGGNGLNPINAVRRAAGLDRLRILPADPQTGQGTSIAAGKYITRRFYAEIITDGQGYSATQVEFQVTRWLSLLSSISTLGRTSGNVRVSKDY